MPTCYYRKAGGTPNARRIDSAGARARSLLRRGKSVRAERKEGALVHFASFPPVTPYRQSAAARLSSMSKAWIIVEAIWKWMCSSIGANQQPGLKPSS